METELMLSIENTFFRAQQFIVTGIVHVWIPNRKSPITTTTF